MGNFVIKPDADKDCYVLWNGTSDGPTFIGTRDETADMLAMYADEGDGLKIDRADQAGSSALWPTPENPIYGWGSEGLAVQLDGLGHRHLPRAHLEAFARAYFSGDDDAAVGFTAEI